jgi:polyphosphate glucokinase
MVLDAKGRPLTERQRISTPQPATPRAVVKAIGEVARAQGPYHRVSVGFPGVVRRGVTLTAANLHPSWAGYRFETALKNMLGKPVRVANDADVQGLGVVEGRGVELVLTLGTGLGSALFVDGALVPNLELGHHPFWRGKTYEALLGNAGLKKSGTAKWNRRLQRAIETLERLFNFDRLYLGGGNARKVSLKLPPHVAVVPNVAGLLGGIALWRAADA